MSPVIFTGIGCFRFIVNDGIVVNLFSLLKKVVHCIVTKKILKCDKRVVCPH